MDASYFLKLIEESKDTYRNNATRLLLNGDTYRAAAAAGVVQFCQDMERSIKFKMDATERMHAEAEGRERRRLDLLEKRRNARKEAAA